MSCAKGCFAKKLGARQRTVAETLRGVDMESGVEQQFSSGVRVSCVSIALQERCGTHRANDVGGRVDPRSGGTKYRTPHALFGTVKYLKNLLFFYFILRFAASPVTVAGVSPSLGEGNIVK